MHRNWCVLIEISMEIGMLIFLSLIGHCTEGRISLYPLQQFTLDHFTTYFFFGEKASLFMNSWSPCGLLCFRLQRILSCQTLLLPGVAETSVKKLQKILTAFPALSSQQKYIYMLSTERQISFSLLKALMN